MSNRAERREALRQAYEQAHPKSETNGAAAATAAGATAPESPAAKLRAQECTPAQIAANRANAQFSCGPVSAEGKAKSSLNALKTGLTGATVLLAGEDAEKYAKHHKSYETLYQPVGPEEVALVQSISDIRWRLDRIPALEQTVVTVSSQRILDKNPALASEVGKAWIEVTARRENEKELRNLNLQENRLARRREREVAELAKLQQARKSKEEEKLKEAAKISLLAQHRNQPLAEVPGIGFDFTKFRYQTFLGRLTPAQKETLLNQAIDEAAAQPQILEAAA